MNGLINTIEAVELNYKGANLVFNRLNEWLNRLVTICDQSSSSSILWTKNGMVMFQLNLNYLIIIMLNEKLWVDII